MIKRNFESEKFVFGSHGVLFYMLMKYTGFLIMFTKIMGIYECSLSWCLFLASVSCQIWDLCDNTNSHRILTLQKAALRLITFSAPRTPSNPIFFNLGILKFFDIVEVFNILFVHQYLNQNLPSDLLKRLKFTKIIHST